MRGALRFAVVALSLATFQMSDATAQSAMVYRHCVLSKSPYGNPSFYSAVFRVRTDTITNGIENDFASYVAARHDPDAISGAICFGPFETYQEADNSRNEIMARDRRNGKNIVSTLWAHRGN